jgi:hypothetical protein
MAASCKATPDRAADGVGVLDDVVPGHARRAGRRSQQRREDPDEGRLARAVGPQEAVDLPVEDFEVQAVDGADAALVGPDEVVDLDGRMGAAGGAQEK